jgi:hypothetical protein
MAHDVLFVWYNGDIVYEGTEYDYVKTAADQITFNYPLHLGDKVFVVLAGTISAIGYGDDVYNSLNQFRQLVDTPHEYFGHGGRAVYVNDSETGLIFKPVHATNEYVTFEATYHLATGQYVEQWVPLLHMGTIKSIKVTPDDGYSGEFYLSAWNNPNGEWVYYSGKITTILYDIMDIPFIDTSGQDSVYIKLENIGPESDFKLKIFILL